VKNLELLKVYFVFEILFVTKKENLKNEFYFFATLENKFILFTDVTLILIVLNIHFISNL